MQNDEVGTAVVVGGEAEQMPSHPRRLVTDRELDNVVTAGEKSDTQTQHIDS
jgi:hypothetical protein